MGSLQNFGGDWTEKKLACIENYLKAYTTALKNQGFTLVYIDAFAGTGYRTLEIANEGQLRLDSVESESKIFDGSARNALDIEPAFQEYVFVEKDSKNSAVLDTLRIDYPEKDIAVLKQDANEFIKTYCTGYWPDNRRAVMFLDPFGLEVDWQSIVRIAETKKIDLWLLFPLSSVMRMLPNHSRISTAWQTKLNCFFGTDSWLERFYGSTSEQEEQLSLLAADVKPKKVKLANYQAITDYFVERLQTVFPREGVVETPMILYNSLGSPLFLLCFAAGNPKGASIARRIALSTVKGV